MLLFGVFCLISFATALPAPLSFELIASAEDLDTTAVQLSAAKEEPEILSLIPDPPELEPLDFLIVDNVEIEVKKDSEENKDEKEEEEANKETEIAFNEIGSTNPEQIVVSIDGEPNKPSFIDYFFPNLSNLSWPNFPSFQLPFNFSNFPSFSNIFGGRQKIYTNTNYRYMLV